LHVRVSDQDLARLIEQGDQCVVVFELIVQFCMLKEHLLVAEERRSDRVVRMLQMLLLLIG